MGVIKEAFEKMVNQVRDTWFLKFDDEDEEILYLSNALAGEVGELANEVKKYIRYRIIEDTPNASKQVLSVEWGIMDILYYLVKIMDVLNINVEDVWEARIIQNKNRWKKMKKAGK